MFKFFGAVVGAGAAINFGTFMVFPILVASVLYSFSSGVMYFWPWLLVLTAYAILLMIVVRSFKGVSEFTCVFFGSLPPALIAIIALRSWTGVFLAGFVATSLMAVASAASTDKEVRDLGKGAGVQTIWLAPLTVMVYNFAHEQASLLDVAATLLCIIMAVFIADDIGIGSLDSPPRCLNKATVVGSSNFRWKLTLALAFSHNLVYSNNIN